MNWDASLSTDMAEVILQHSSPLALGSLAGTCRALRDQVKEIAKTNRKLDRFAVAAAHAGMPADCVATGLMNWYDLNCYRADQPAKALQNFLVTLGRDGKLCCLTVAQVIEACHALSDIRCGFVDTPPSSLGAARLLGRPDGSNRFKGVALVKVILGSRGGHLIRGILSVDLQLPATGAKALPGCALWALDGDGQHNPFGSHLDVTFRWEHGWRYGLHTAPSTRHLRVSNTPQLAALPLCGRHADYYFDTEDPRVRTRPTSSWLQRQWHVVNGNSVRDFAAYCSAAARLSLPTPRSLYAFLTDPVHVRQHHLASITHHQPSYPFPAEATLKLLLYKFLDDEHEALRPRVPDVNKPLETRRRILFITTPRATKVQSCGSRSIAAPGPLPRRRRRRRCRRRRCRCRCCCCCCCRCRSSPPRLPASSPLRLCRAH